ncbi:MAG TPA: prephenate dehydrogenase [Candidatus Methylomirabilis sp.]|nr:prephenate dehydrogenase [Candidatus Methylomirabilis sp.]
MPIRQITIVGTGLIGGSLALALRHSGFAGTIVGCDKRSVLETATERKAIDRAEADLERAVVGSDVIVFATPVGTILSQFEAVAPTLPATTLITDTGSTKQKLVERARMVFGDEAGKRVLPGHPMAGKEFSGVEHADADLFQGAVWLITPITANQQHTPLQEEFLELLSKLGARIIELDPERHDLLCAWISHLPQMISTALTSVLHEELGDDEIVTQIGGRALREMTRIGRSPYSMWRDIALTNSENIEDVMLRFEQQMTHLRENLKGPELREMFESANRFERKP